MTMQVRQPASGGEYDFFLGALPAVTPRGVYRSYAKRALDLAIVAVLALPAAMIVLLLVALIVVDGGRPFYKQERVGKDGRKFWMWKLRSMVRDADQVLEAYLAENDAARAEWDHHQKLRHDPRVTRIGRIIRASSLDELPQLFNVAMGDMSIVGPRPMMVCQRSLYPGAAYYTMRPGITGYWQTSARNEASFKERAHYDTAYFRDLSLQTDVAVLWRTVGVVLRGTGY